jgi:hypothetical protein
MRERRTKMIISGRLRRELSTDKDFVILINPISVCCVGKEIEIRDRSFRKYTKEFPAEAIAEKEMERIEMLMALGGTVLRIGEKV